MVNIVLYEAYIQSFKKQIKINDKGIEFKVCLFMFNVQFNGHSLVKSKGIAESHEFNNYEQFVSTVMYLITVVCSWILHNSESFLQCMSLLV